MKKDWNIQRMGGNKMKGVKEKKKMWIERRVTKEIENNSKISQSLRTIAVFSVTRKFGMRFFEKVATQFQTKITTMWWKLADSVQKIKWCQVFWRIVKYKLPSLGGGGTGGCLFKIEWVSAKKASSCVKAKDNSDYSIHNFQNKRMFF